MYLATEVAISTINAARHQRLTEEFVPFLAIYYYLSQFIDCPTGDSSIAATVVQRRRLKSPPKEVFFQAVVIVDIATSGLGQWVLSRGADKVSGSRARAGGVALKSFRGQRKILLRTICFHPTPNEKRPRPEATFKASLQKGESGDVSGVR